MFLQSQLDDETVLFIDVEPTQGFAKDEGTHDFHPNEVLDNVVKVSTVVAQRLADTASAAAAASEQPPARLRLEFGIKIDMNSVVALAPNPSGCHFKITAEWTPQT